MANRILVIDDSSTIRKLVELSFRQLPVAVEYAQSGTDGLAKAKVNAPDIVLLDIILPDMRGIDVCQQLAKDTKTAHASVVLMTGKDESVREQFRGFPQVVGYLHKPFTAADLIARINAVNTRSTEREVVKQTSRLPFEKREAIAQALYGKMKPHLAYIPDWMAQLGGSQPASFFARRLLSPELLDELVEALLPFLQAPAAQPEVVSNASYEGRVSQGFPLLEVLRSVAKTERTGVLLLTGSSSRWWVYVRKGIMVNVSTDSVVDYMRGAELDLASLPPAQRDHAIQEQQKTGKPVFVSLAESGLVPSAQLSTVLHEQGMRALMALLDSVESGSLKFAWTDIATLPLFVEANGREMSFDQIRLEQLRRAASQPTTEPADAGQSVYERTPGFSRRLRQFSLLQEERRVLTLVDGKQTVAKISKRSGVALRQVLLVLHRLADVELIRRVSLASSRKVVVVDEGEISKQLQSLLSKRSAAVDVVGFQPNQPDLTQAIKREAPSLLIVCVSALAQTEFGKIKSLCERPDFSHVETIAILDDRDQPRIDELSLSGFGHVYVKPVYLGDIERTLEGLNG
jgi:CheY-like chemotaxis protein